MSNTFIIAEAGVNHNGELSIAKKLVDAAADAGADAVKFQTFIPESLTSSTAGMADYQKRNTGTSRSQLDMLRQLVLFPEEHYQLIKYCNEKRITFCSSAFDLDSVDFLKELNLPFWKIPSGEITNYPYLKKIAQFNQTIILSTGMSTLADIESAIELFVKFGTERDKITLLHCNTEYPTPPEDVNLNVIRTLKQAFNLDVGFSDHTLGIEFPIAAVALGATVIEKHITIDKELAGPDHQASLNPAEFKKMVSAVRNISKGLGSQIKRLTDSENRNIAVARKSITAAHNIKKGELYSEENLTTKRPGTGLSPWYWDSLVGKSANRDYEKDEMIEFYYEKK